MRILQNRVVAAVLVVCIVVLATLVGAGISLHSEQEDLRVGYQNGFSGTRGLADYIAIMVDDCRNLLTLAGNYPGEGDALSAELERCIAQVEANSQPDAALWQAIQELYAAKSDLDLHLFNNQALDEHDKTMLDRLAANIDTNYHVVVRERAVYNGAVEEFNRKLDRFPANLLSGIIGIRPVELFGESEGV